MTPAMRSKRAVLAVVTVASVGYSLCFATATAVSIRGGHKAEPLRIRTPWSVQTDVLLGFGTGLAAPWPLMAVFWGDLKKVLDSEGTAKGPLVRLAVEAALFMIGCLCEPVSRRLSKGQLGRGEAALVVLNLGLPIPILAGATVLIGETGRNRRETVTVPERSSD